MSQYNLSTINWLVSGSPAYNQYDLNPYFLTPNNINDIITGYNIYVNMLNTCQINVDICNQTLINNFTYLNTEYNDLNQDFQDHKNNKNENIRHVTSEDIKKWNEASTKSSVYSINNMTGNVEISITSLGGVTTKKFEQHITNQDSEYAYKHVLPTDINNWNNKIDKNTGIYVRTVNGNYGNVTINADTLNIVKSINAVNGNINLVAGNQNVEIETNKETKIINIKVKETMPIGTFMWWFGTTANIPAGWHICDGTAIPASSKLGNIGLTNYPLLTDDRYIQGSNTANILGNAGLPDIIGYMNTFGAFGGGGGAFVYKRTGGDTPKMESGTQNCASNMTFRASHYNEAYTVYGQSDTVTPKHITAIPIIYEGI